jgi:hypothetical protein
MTLPAASVPTLAPALDRRLPLAFLTRRPPRFRDLVAFLQLERIEPHQVAKTPSPFDHLIYQQVDGLSVVERVLTER